MKKGFVLGTVLAALCVAAMKAEDPQPLPLWNGEAPIGDGTTSPTPIPTITVFRPAKPNGAVIVVCPGGGYGGVGVSGAEGALRAKWLNEFGIVGVVLNYRLPKGRNMVPLLDLQRALRTARAKAPEWGCDPHRVGVLGFSAGGHLASSAATHFDSGNSKAADPIDQVDCRPDFALLVYPVISMDEKAHQGSKSNLLGPNPSAELVEFFSNHKRVTDKTPPTFLVHASDDTVVPPENSRWFYAALLEHKVHAHYLEVPSGGHGLNGYKGPMWDAWLDASIQWLADEKIIPAQKP